MRYAEALVLSMLILGGCSDRPESTARKGAVDSAYKLCQIYDRTGVGSQRCEVDGWDSSVKVYLNMDVAEAANFCPQAAEQARSQFNLHFERPWQLRIFSPFSGANSTAACSLA